MRLKESGVQLRRKLQFQVPCEIDGFCFVSLRGSIPDCRLYSTYTRPLSKEWIGLSITLGVGTSTKTAIRPSICQVWSRVDPGSEDLMPLRQRVFVGGDASMRH